MNTTRSSMSKGFSRLHQLEIGDERPHPPSPAPAPAAVPATPAESQPRSVADTPNAVPLNPKLKPKSMNIRISGELHLQLRRMAAETDRRHHDIVTAAIAKYVSKYKDPTT